jgi:hypothetical protein
MRTTLSIDDDVLAAAHERARAEGRTVGHVISELARAALTGSTPDQADEEFFGFRPFPRRGGVVTDQTVDAIRDSEGL